MLVVVGLSHHTAPVGVRERLAVSPDALPDVLARLTAKASVGEVMCLSTCNRVEVFAAPAGAGVELERVADEVAEVLVELASPAAEGPLHPHLYRRTGRDGLTHLFRVASSLDSLVIGEPQILGQVKDAFDRARAAGTVGPTLTRVLDRALRTAKRVRSETAIGSGMVSISSVAVDLARQIFGELRGRRALLVGAGQMAEAAAQLLAREGARLDVLNRSPERAVALAREIGGTARPITELASALVDADVVVASTSSPGFVLTHAEVARAHKLRRGRTLFFIDIAVPRDVEPSVNALDNVFLYDVDDLEAVVRDSFEGRRAEAQKAELLVVEEVGALDTWVEARGVIPTVVALRQKAKATMMAELERTLSGRLKHLPEADRAALEAMVEGTVNKLLHAPVTHLKRAAAEPRGEAMAQTLRELFELPDVSVVAEPAAGRRGSDLA